MNAVSQDRAGTKILTMNRGSATLKAALYYEAQATSALSIKVDRADGSGGQVTISDASGKALLNRRVGSNERSAALDVVFDWLQQRGELDNLGAVGHRIVHGGAQFTQPQRVTLKMIAELEKLAPLDPDHLPEALAGIRFILQKFPELPQIACFDTSFHSGLPTVASMYAIPRRFYDAGMRRYGFHGLSYEYVLGELRKLEGARTEGRVIIAHLGNGASMVALYRGKSVDTSMGFTPLEGLVMGTRAGDTDPGLLLHLLEQQKMPAAELDTLLNKRSGLLGVSGSSEDVRDLLENCSKDAHAAQAIELFCYRAKKYIGAYAAALGGIDLLAFTGGIGEHAVAVRDKICAGLEFLGIQLDPQRNNSNASVISRDDAQVKVRVVATNEDLTIVRHVRAALGWA